MTTPGPLPSMSADRRVIESMNDPKSEADHNSNVSYKMWSWAECACKDNDTSRLICQARLRDAKLSFRTNPTSSVWKCVRGDVVCFSLNRQPCARDQRPQEVVGSVLGPST